MNMRMQALRALTCLDFRVVTILLMTGMNAHAASPFRSEDFVPVPQFEGIEIQKNEVTYAQWSALNPLLPSENQNPWESQECFSRVEIARGFGPNFPTACVSLFDAEAYIRVLNAQDLNYEYRLPTDSELKKLVDLTLDALNVTDSYQALSTHAWYYPFAGKRAQEVCTKEPVFGLCDVLGNLWEWTSSKADASPSDNLILGGSWDFELGYLLGIRLINRPDGRGSNIGFRLVRTAVK